MIGRKAGGLDFEISGGGTVFLVRPRTARGRSWLAESIPSDATRFGDGVAVEHRYIMPLVEGMITEGFEVARL